MPLGNVKLSCAEADLVAAITACGRTIRIAPLADDWSIELVGRVHVDSSAAIGVAHRRGDGKLRQVRVGTLWIQELVGEGEIEGTSCWDDKCASSDSERTPRSDGA